MQIASGCRDGGMAEGSLHERHRGVAVQGVAGMGVTEPVRRGGGRDSGSRRGLLDDAVDLHRSEMMHNARALCHEIVHLRDRLPRGKGCRPP
jgi:hypothetical protein